MMKRGIIFLLAVLGLCAVSAPAQIPELLSYQGVLTDGAGVAVPDGDYNLTFWLYDVPSGGTHLWKEIHAAVAVRKGTFNVILGSEIPIDLPFDKPYYLAIAVEGGVALVPRQQLTSSAYSLGARGTHGTANVFPPEGGVGIGTLTPDQALVVDGGVKIGSPSTPTEGTMRYSGDDFEGYDGSTWRSFTNTGTGTVPTGTGGQTLRHSGTAWVATSNLYNTGTYVGIGTTSPASKLHVYGDAQEYVSIESSLMWGGAHLVFKTPGGAFDFLQVSKYGPSASGNASGIPLANLSIVNAGLESGPLMLRTAAEKNMHFVTNSIERMRLTGAGALEFYNPSYQKTIAVGESDVGGGQMLLYDDAGAVRTMLSQTVDESAYFGMMGSASYAEFYMDRAGNSSVILPASSVGRSEMLDEPGVASYTMGTGYVSVTTGGVILGSRSITTPADGFVLVIATTEVLAAHTQATESEAQFGVSMSSTVFPENQDVSLRYDVDVPTGIRAVPVTCHGLFWVSGAGTQTFYFLARKGVSGIFQSFDIQLTLAYFPGAYGTVDVTAAGGAAEDDSRMERPALAEADIARERSEAETFAIARIERELAEMRVELERLKTTR